MEMCREGGGESDFAVQRIVCIDGFQFDQLARACRSVLQGVRHRAQRSGLRDLALRLREAKFAVRHRAMDERKGDIAAEQRAAVVGDAGQERVGERADGGNGGNAQHQRGEENAEAGKAAAQFPPRQPNEPA